MDKLLIVVTACLMGLINPTLAGTTIVDNINQDMPPGTVNSEQILIIDNDEFGNQRTLNIGYPGGTITRPKPCKRNQPMANMDCTGKDLRGVQWNGARLSGSQFDGADMRGVSMKNAQLENATFNGTRLDKADLSGARLINCDFNSANLSGSRLNNAKIINADFMDADLTGADFTGANLINAEFMAARLAGAIWIDGQRCAKGSIEECRR